MTTWLLTSFPAFPILDCFSQTSASSQVFPPREANLTPSATPLPTSRTQPTVDKTSLLLLSVFDVFLFCLYVDDLLPESHIQKFLTRTFFIDELQRVFEDEKYRSVDVIYMHTTYKHVRKVHESI